MTVSPSIPATVQIRRGRLLGLIGAVAMLAAATTAALLVLAVGTGSSTVAAESAPPALSAEEQGYLDMLPILPAPLAGLSVVSSLTPAERSVGSYLFGTSGTLAPGQLRSVRSYLSGASEALTPAERSVGSYLFGASTSLTPAQRQTVRDYLSGASGR